MVGAFPALLALCAINQGFDPNMFGKGGPACKAYTCSKGFVPVPKRPLRLKSPGCHGFGMSMFSANQGKDGKEDALLGCCNLRHACYGICGASKARCEKDFKKCTEDTCKAITNEEDKKSCDSSASIHVMSASFGGCTQFDAAQRNSCDCVKKGKAEKRRHQSLNDFYKKHNKDKLGDVDKLWEKHGKKDAWKFAKFMNKLVAKYPKAIKHETTKEQQMYDDILKGNYKAPDSGSDSNKPEAGKESGTDSKAGEEAESDDADEAEFINDADTDEVMDLDENAGHDEM
jgi:hypothetical protein